MTAVPTVSWNPAVGFVVPPPQNVLVGFQSDINSALGGGLNPALSTPQGQLATSEAAVYDDVMDTFVFYTTQTDPATASGRMQDAIGRIYFLERNPSQPTVAQCICTGLSGVVIPVNALAVDEDGNIYSCTEAGTIPVGGSITLPFACNLVGPIACPANTLNAIYQAIPGWDTINNPTDGVLGNEVESKQAFEARRAASVALNSIGSLPSVKGAVLSVSNVLDAYVTENDSSSPVTIGGVSLAAKSLYVAAVGGDPTSICAAIWSKKAPGCGYNGNTTETILDESPGYSPPFPSYQVTFEIPSALAIMFKVNIANNPQVPANAAALIQAAIIQSFSGADGGVRATIGSTIYATRFMANIYALGPWVQIISIQLGSSNSPSATFTGIIATTTLTVSSVSGTIAIGQTLSDSAGNVIEGTTIVSGSGTNWQVSNLQVVGTEAMATSVANLNDVVVNINQVPTVSASNIQVILT
jgi:hypothetical protein